MGLDALNHFGGAAGIDRDHRVGIHGFQIKYGGFDGVGFVLRVSRGLFLIANGRF